MGARHLEQTRIGRSYWSILAICLTLAAAGACGTSSSDEVDSRSRSSYDVKSDGGNIDVEVTGEDDIAIRPDGESESPMGEEGGTCYPNETCNGDLVCDAETGTCLVCEDGTAGCPCYPNATCNAGMLCDIETATCAPCSEGTEDCDCYGNDTCNEPLVCVQGKCLGPSVCPDGQDCSGVECGPDPVCGASCGDCPGLADCVEGKCKGFDDLIIPEGEADIPDSCDEGASDFEFSGNSKVYEIPLAVWVELDGGKPALTPAQLKADLDHVNAYYGKAGIEFYQFEVAEFSDEGDINYDSHYVTLVYYHNLQGLCGQAIKGPCSTPYAKVDSACVAPSGNTTPHELGHALGLHHPHGTPDAGADPVEPLDSSCYKTLPDEGDYLCDTPPDPSNKYCLVDEQCVAMCEPPYEAYAPLTSNVMSYYPDQCQTPDTGFTTEQASTMRCIFDKFYSNDMACPGNNCGGCAEVCKSVECGIHSGCNCGDCPPDFFCDSGTCAKQPCDELCVGVECGLYKDCDCGGCGEFEICINHECEQKGCPAICSDAGKDCGNYYGCPCGSCDDVLEKCENKVCIPKACDELCIGIECGAYYDCDCGNCTGNDSCENNLCISPDCQDVCGGKECGVVEDCSCGVCGWGKKCEQHECTADCPVLCAGKECDEVDGCPCGSCGFEEECTNFQCVPDCGQKCVEKECDVVDGCDCGSCGVKEKCEAFGCVPDCVQVCSGKDCGQTAEGCDCGTCGWGNKCEQHQCVPDCPVLCSGKGCGSVQGCDCGTCPSCHNCNGAGQCVKDCACVCAGKECGDYQNCNCGSCVDPEICSNYQCTCAPVCGGKQCGPDGCGGNCGTCADTAACQTGVCVETCDDSFEPNNSCGTAAPISPGNHTDLVMPYPNDDYYKIDVGNGKTLDVGILNATPGYKWQLYLHNEDCTGMALDYWESSDSTIGSVSWTNSTGGTVAVRVWVGANQMSCDLKYDLAVGVF